MHYLNPAIKQLKDQQVKYAPREVRLRQIQRAEGMLSRLELDGSYRYPDLCEQITTYRPELYPDLVLTGEEALHDLRCFIEDLSDSAELTPDNVGERVYTVQEQVMTEAAIDSGLTRDLYVSLGDPLGEGRWLVKAQLKPFVDWIWGGCLLMALGGLLAATDRRYRMAIRERKAVPVAA